MTRYELIEKMAKVMWASFYVAYAGPHWDNAPTATQEAWRRAAAKGIDDVAAPVLLGDSTPEEVLSFRSKFPTMPDPIGAHFSCYMGFRRAQYTPPPDPAIEAVVKLMSPHLFHFGFKDAEIIVAAVRTADAAKGAK